MIIYFYNLVPDKDTAILFIVITLSVYLKFVLICIFFENYCTINSIKFKFGKLFLYEMGKINTIRLKMWITLYCVDINIDR